MTEVFIVTLGDRLLLAQLPRCEPLRDKLERAIVVSSEAVPADAVTMNSRVRFVDSGGEHVAALVYPAAAGRRARCPFSLRAGRRCSVFAKGRKPSSCLPMEACSACA